jgi:hypothetical protein
MAVGPTIARTAQTKINWLSASGEQRMLSKTHYTLRNRQSELEQWS